jgi:hypothetical protein
MVRLWEQICYGPNQANYLAEVARLHVKKYGPYPNTGNASYPSSDGDTHKRRLEDLLAKVRDTFRPTAVQIHRAPAPPTLINDDDAPPITTQQTRGLIEDLRLIVSKVYAEHEISQAQSRKKSTPIFGVVNGFMGDCTEVAALRLRNFPSSLGHPLSPQFDAAIETHTPGNYQFALRDPSPSPTGPTSHVLPVSVTPSAPLPNTTFLTTMTQDLVSDDSGQITLPDDVSLQSHTFTRDGWAHSSPPSCPIVLPTYPSSRYPPLPLGPPPPTLVPTPRSAPSPMMPLVPPPGHPRPTPPPAVLSQPPLSISFPTGHIAPPPSSYSHDHPLTVPLWLELAWAKANSPEAKAILGPPPPWTEFLALHYPPSGSLATTLTSTTALPLPSVGELSASSHSYGMDAHLGPQPLTRTTARRSTEAFPTQGSGIFRRTDKVSSSRVHRAAPPQISLGAPSLLPVAPISKLRKRKGSGTQPHRQHVSWAPAPKAARLDVQPGISTGRSTSSRDFSTPGDYPNTASFTSTPLAISPDPSPPAPTSAREALYVYLQERDLLMANYPSLNSLTDRLADTPTSSSITREVCIDQQTLGGCPHIASPYHDHPRPLGQHGFIRYYHYNMATLPHRHFPSTEILTTHNTSAFTPPHASMPASAVRDYEEIAEATRFSHIGATRVVNQHARLQPGHFPQFSTHDDSDRTNTLRYEDTIPLHDILRIPLNLLALPSYSSARDRSWAILFRSRILKPPSVPAPFLPPHSHSPHTTYMRHDTDHSILRPFVVRAHPHSHLFNPTLRQSLDSLFTYLNADNNRPDHAAEFLADLVLYRERNSNPFLARLRAEAPLVSIPQTNITGEWPSPESSENSTADRESYPVGLQFLLTALATKHDLRSALPTEMLLPTETLSFHCQRILGEGPHAPVQVSAGIDFLGPPGPTPRAIPYNVDDPRLTPSHRHYMDLQPVQLTEMHNQRRKRYYESRTSACPVPGADDDTVVSAQPHSLPSDFSEDLRAQYQINHDEMNKLPCLDASLFLRRELQYDRANPKTNTLHSSFPKRVSSRHFSHLTPAWLPPQHHDSMEISWAGSPTDSDSQDEADSPHDSASPDADDPPQDTRSEDGEYEEREGDLVSGLTASDGGGPEQNFYPTVGPDGLILFPPGINVSREFYPLTRSWGHFPPYCLLRQVDQRRLTSLLHCLHSRDPTVRIYTQVKLLEDLFAVAPANALSVIREEDYWITPLPPSPTQTKLAKAVTWRSTLDSNEIFRLSHIRLLSPQDPLIVNLQNSTADKLLPQLYAYFDQAALRSQHRNLRPLLRHFGWDVDILPRTQKGVIKWVGITPTTVAYPHSHPTWVAEPPPLTGSPATDTWVPAPGYLLSPTTPTHTPSPPTLNSSPTHTASDVSTFSCTPIPHTPPSHSPGSGGGTIPHPHPGFYRNPVLSSAAPVSSLPCLSVAPQPVTTHRPVIGDATPMAASHDAPASTTPPSQA